MKIHSEPIFRYGCGVTLVQILSCFREKLTNYYYYYYYYYYNYNNNNNNNLHYYVEQGENYLPNFNSSPKYIIQMTIYLWLIKEQTKKAKAFRFSQMVSISPSLILPHISLISSNEHMPMTSSGLREQAQGDSVLTLQKRSVQNQTRIRQRKRADSRVEQVNCNGKMRSVR